MPCPYGRGAVLHGRGASATVRAAFNPFQRIRPAWGTPPMRAQQARLPDGQAAPLRWSRGSERAHGQKAIDRGYLRGREAQGGIENVESDGNGE